MHRLESAVVTWSKQIKNVLKADPDAVLKVDQARRGSTGGGIGLKQTAV